MRNLLVFVFLANFVFASYVGSPAAPSIRQLISYDGCPEICSDATNARLDYEREYMYNMNLEFSLGEPKSRIQRASFYGDFLTLTANLFGRMDLYAKGGVVNPGFQFGLPNNDLGSSNEVTSRKPIPAWAGGAKLLLIKTERFSFAIEGSYFTTEHRNLLLYPLTAPDSSVNPSVSWYSWQGSAAVGWSIYPLVPYLGAKYSHTQVTFIQSSPFAALPTIKMDNRHRFGGFLGCSVITSRYFEMNIEGRFWDEQSVSGTLGFRFLRIIFMKHILSLFLMSYISLFSDNLFAPNANLITEGLPDISIDIVGRVQKYTDFCPTLFLDLHPNQSQMLVKTRPLQGQVMQLCKIDDVDGKPICLTAFPDAIANALYQPTEGLYCVFSKDVDGTEKFQNYRYDFDTDTITLLTDGKSRNTLGAWSPKGDKMAFTSNERNGKDQDVYIIDPLTPESKHLVAEFSGGDSWWIKDWSPDGTSLLISEWRSISDSNLWSLDLADGSLALLTPKNQEDQTAYFQARYSSDGSNIFFMTDKDCEFKTLATLDMKTGRLKYLTQHINWDIDLYEISPDGSQIACVSNENGVSRIHLITFSENGNDIRVLDEIPVGVIIKITWEQNGKSLRFNLSSAKSVNDIYTLALSDGTLKRLTQNKSTMATDHFVEPKLVTWKSFDGKEISGFLYRPTNANGAKSPVRVIIHGGPEAQFRPEFLGPLNYYTDELGVALLFPNIRGSTGFGKTFLQLPNGLKRVDAYEDLNALLDWIKAQPDLDGDRIMVSGNSYGGHATLAVATRYNDKIACSLSIVGMSNLVTFLKNTEIRRRDLRRAVYGDERIPVVRDFLESIAPIHHAKAITKPIFVVQGLMDPRVPYSESEQIVKTLKEANTPVWFLTAKNEGHGFSKKENADFLFYATIEFVQRHLLNIPTGD